MRARATIRAAAFLVNGAVFLVGLGRLQGRLAPPDFIYVGLLLGSPAVSWLALVLVIVDVSIRKSGRQRRRRRFC